MTAIGQYYYKSVNGAGGRVKITPGFEEYNHVFYKRGAFSEGEFAPPALLYDYSENFYFVGREEMPREEDDVVTVRHGFLFPRELFEKNVFGAKLYHFFDIDDFDCTPQGFDKEDLPSVIEHIHVAAESCDFLRPEDIFRSYRDHTRFVKLLFYAVVMAVTDDFSLVLSLPEKDEGRYARQAVLFLKSLFAMVPWEWRQYLTFHSCVDDYYAIGGTKLAVTPLAPDRLLKNNKTFIFDLHHFRVSPDLVIEQKTRGTLIGNLLYLIWFNQDDKGLSSFFYIVHHNRRLLTEDTPKIVEMDALVCFFLLTETGAKYRELLETELSRLSKGTAREILLFLAGHLSNRKFLSLREMLNI